jgi:aryl-alcohol dehydrogenase-like predicted oxidoreductase
MQNHYNLLYREEEREMFPTLKVRSDTIAFGT